MKRTRILILSALVSVLSLATFGIGTQGASAATSGVSVQGTGTVKVAPDTVRLNSSITFVGATNSAASKAVSTSAAAFRTALKKDRKSTRLNSSHSSVSRMPSSA